MPYHWSKNVLFLAYLSFETKKVVGSSGLCDYRVSSLASAKSLTIFKFVSVLTTVNAYKA